MVQEKMLPSSVSSALSVATDMPLGVEASSYIHKSACKISAISHRGITSTSSTKVAMP